MLGTSGRKLDPAQFTPSLLPCTTSARRQCQIVVAPLLLECSETTTENLRRDGLRPLCYCVSQNQGAIIWKGEPMMMEEMSLQTI